MEQTMWNAIWISIIGFLSGSVLYAKLIPRLMCKVDICQVSEDGNPGTANVFKYCGKKCGILTSILEFAKGFFPVAVSHGILGVNVNSGIFGLVILAPVLGHMFSLFNHFDGGIGIAPLFGTLIAIYPFTVLLILLVLAYVFGKYVIKFKDRNNRTFFVFIVFGIATFLLEQIVVVKYTYSLLSVLILGRKKKSLTKRQNVVLE